jgi:catechol-2,3-dioxygenase
VNDERPPMWIGHVQMEVPDVAAAKEFFLKLGMRDVFPDASEIAILELRAGTHLIVQESQAPVVKSTPAAFDLMVEDIEATHASLEQNGFKPSELLRGRIHTTFKVTEPNGHVITYLNSHNTGLPV